MIPVADILQEPQFGGEELEMKMIRSYKKAMREIKTQHITRETPKNDDVAVEEGGGGGDASNKQKKRAAWVAKQKARAEEK